MSYAPTDARDDDGVPGGPENIVEHRLVEEMQDSYFTYSMSVIMSRALPNVRGAGPSISRGGQVERSQDVTCLQLSVEPRRSPQK
jgi:hypothetical protein